MTHQKKIALANKCTFIIFLLAVCALSVSPSSLSAKVTLHVSSHKNGSTNTPQHYYRLLKAAYYQNRQEFHKAAQLYNSVFSYLSLFSADKKSINPAIQGPIINAYLLFLFQTGRYKEFIAIAQKAPTWRKKSTHSLLLLRAQLMTNAIDSKQLEDAFTAHITQWPDDTDARFYYIAYLMDKNKLVHAQTCIHQTLQEKRAGRKAFLFYYLQAKIVWQKKDFEKALSWIKQSCSHNTNFTKAFLLQADILEKLGKTKEAIAIYEKHLSSLTDNPHIKQKLFSLHCASGQYKKALQLHINNKQETASYYRNLSIVQAKLNNYAAAFKAIQKAYALNKKDIAVFKLYLKYLVALNKTDIITTTICEFIEHNARHKNQLTALISLDKKIISPDHLLALIETQALATGSYLLCFIIGDFYLSHKNYIKAEKFYRKALQDKLVKNSRKQSQLYFQLAYSLFAQKNKAEANRYSMLACSCRIAYPSAYNLAALTTNNTRQALRLIGKALRCAPDNKWYKKTAIMLIKRDKNRT